MSTKQTLSLRQQKIRNVLQFEKENGNDLTKKELIDRIRQILEQDYQMNQRLKEKELRAEEIRRIRKLRMDGKISSEEEEYLTQSYQNQKPPVEEKEEKIVFQTFQPNPVHHNRNKEIKKSKSCNEDSAQTIEKESEVDQKEKVDEEKTIKTSEEVDETKESEEKEVAEEKQTEEENVEVSETETNKEEKTENEDSHGFQREKSELTIALENETSLIKLYELAEKMVYVSPKK